MQLKIQSTLTPVCNKGKGHKNNNKTGTLSPAWQCTKSSSLPITPQLYGRAQATGATCILDTCSPSSVCTSVSFTRDTTLALSIVLWHSSFHHSGSGYSCSSISGCKIFWWQYQLNTKHTVLYHQSISWKKKYFIRWNYKILLITKLKKTSTFLQGIIHS